MAESSLAIERTYAADGGVRDDTEFRAAFLAHYERVISILVRVTGNRGDAEDLASEVFLRLSRQSPAWLLENNVGGWLYRTAMHLGFDFLRSRKRQLRREETSQTVHDHAGGPRSGPLAEAIRAEEADCVRTALGAMKPARAQILLMRAEGASYEELAAALKVSVGSVGTLLNRAEAEFKKRYGRVSARKETR